MTAKAKSDNRDIAKVGVPTHAWSFMQDFFRSLESEILVAAARRAKARHRGKGPLRVEKVDVLRVTRALLPGAVVEVERMLEEESGDVRNAS